MDEESNDAKHLKQKGLSALFSSADDGPTAQGPGHAYGRADRRNRVGSRIPTYVLSLITLFFFYWMVSTYLEDVYFRNYVYNAFSQYNSSFSRYLPPISLLAIGSIGLVLSVVWGIVVYRSARVVRAEIRLAEDCL